MASTQPPQTLQVADEAALTQSEPQARNDHDATREQTSQSAGAIPAEVEFILSALEVGRKDASERRRERRRRYHVAATLRLYTDGPDATPWVLYSRDVDARGIGFITRHRLPLGYGGLLTVTSPNGHKLVIDCTLQRCRETVNGWFDGSLAFNREQWALA